MEKAQKLKVGFLSALVPTILVILLVTFIIVVVNYVSKMGPNEINRKAEYYSQLADYAPKNATVFFGDSITELCRTNDIYGEYSEKSGIQVLNRGISAETTDSMLARLDSSIIAIKPRNLVMLMGVNDLNKGTSQEQINDNIRSIIKRVKEKSPETNIVLEAVYPTDTDRKSAYERIQLKGRDSATIASLNKKLAEMAQKEDVRFLDVTDILADENGNLRKDYTFDGLHPNISGYLAVRDSIIAELI